MTIHPRSASCEHFEFESFGRRREADMLAAFGEVETFSKTRQRNGAALGIVDRHLVSGRAIIITSDVVVRK